VVFGDRIQISAGQLAIEAGGIAALIVGVVMVARSSAFSGLRKVTDVIEVIKPHGDDTARHHDAPHTTPADLNGRSPNPDLNGRRHDPDLNGGRPDPDQAGRLDAARARRMPRRPLHGPASGEEGG
jgi:hypothetical protein